MEDEKFSPEHADTLSREFLRTYEIRRIQSCLDGLMTVWLLYVFTVDSLPIGPIIIAIVAILVWQRDRFFGKYRQIDAYSSDTFRKTFKLSPLVNFGIANPDDTSSRAQSFLLSNWIILSEYRYKQNNLSVIAHEATHIKRADSLINFAFSWLSKFYLLFAAFAIVVSFFFAPPDLPSIYTEVGFWQFVAYYLIFVVPGVAIFFMGRGYRFRREFIADAEAHFAYPRQNLETLRKSSLLETARVRAADEKPIGSHPLSSDRISYLTGEKRIGSHVLFANVIGVGLIMALVGMRAGLGFIDYDEVSRVQNSSGFLRSSINVCLQVYAVFLLGKVSCIIACGYKSGLHTHEKAICFLLFCLFGIIGALVHVRALNDTLLNILQGSTELQLLVLSLLILPFYMPLLSFLWSKASGLPVSTSSLVLVAWTGPVLYSLGIKIAGTWFIQIYDLGTSGLLILFFILFTGVSTIGQWLERDKANRGARKMSIKTILDIQK